MRISDWSSDVCSSDLLRELGYEIEFDPRRGLCEIRDVPNDLIYAMSRRAEQIDAHAKEHGLQGQAERSISFFATRPPKQKVDLDTLHAQWAERRSEEHTSELQSLMRISYAVFCLKKKTIITSTYPPNINYN